MLKISKIAVPGVAEPYDIGTLSIPFGQVDSTSTDTAYTAQIEGITSLYDGVCVYLKNGVITSNKNGFTLNINSLGAKPVYDTLAAATRSGTVFNVDYTMLFIYNSSRVSGGCWDIFYGYNSDTTDLEEALTPLVGTTQTVTPSQVFAAIKAGRDVALQHNTNLIMGTFVFSAFNVNETQGVVVSNLILPQLEGITGTLVGSVANDEWTFAVKNMATKDDVNTAVDEALAQAKASGEFDGADGKSAYAYAQDGGYTGTEAEFAEKLAAEIPAVDDTLTASGKAADAAVVGNRLSSLSEEIANLGGDDDVSVEPAEDDIPKVFFGGALQQTKDAAVVSFRYISKTQDISGYAEIKAQGNSSMSYPKKNQTVKLFRDADCTEKLKVDFKGWGAQNKHVYKANWIDLSHARNVVSARLWADVVKSRAGYENLPELLRTSPNQGAVDGFPVKVYAAGVYQGRYTLNIPKDKWMVNMDDALDTHCILCGENYVSGCFRAAASINGRDWTDEIHDTVPESIKTRWNEVISFVMNSTDEEFKANLDKYFDVESLLDYHLFGLVSCGLDAYGKNQIYMTYDGQKWIASMYDMDSTWGLWWTGESLVATDYDRSEYQDFKDGEGNLLYIRLEELFYEELQARWAELRSGALSIDSIINRFERFTDIAPEELVKEDYASTTGDGAFTRIPSRTTSTIQQIRAYAVARHAWCDTYVAGLTPFEEVPCTGISLSSETLTFIEAGTQTLTATVTPDGCTEDITWSSDNVIVATVSGGVVTAIANGSTTIKATCGAYSASCSVVVNMPAQGVAESYGILEGISMYSGYLTETDGTPRESSTDVYSDPVNIDFELSNEITRAIMIAYTSEIDINCRIVFYGENDVFVSAASGSKTRLNIPSEAKSFRLSLFGSGASVKITIEESTNFFKVSTIDGAYDPETGAFNAEDTPSCHTKTTVDTRDGWEVSNVWGVFFFDSDDNYISKISPTYGNQITKITVPQNAASIAACTEDSRASIAVLAHFTTIDEGGLTRI